MANQIRSPGLRMNVTGYGLAFSAAAVVLSYTVPANKSASVTHYGINGMTATTVVVVEVVQSGGTWTVRVPAAGANFNLDPSGYQLIAGDVFQFRVSSPTALDTGDCWVSLIQEA